jgi:signal transduction histidine kinase
MTNPSQDGADKKVFSLWPGTAPPEREDTSAVPAWALNAERATTPSIRPAPGAFALAGGGVVALAGIVAALLGAQTIELALWVILIGLILASGYALHRHHRRSGSEAAWRDALFERSGISLWREDWTPVGEAIRALKLAGVHDIQAHFAARPDDARALRRRVMIKDVNAFTVEMMGARSKADFIGSLDRILPDSDQTFDQWLVAFGRGDAFYRSETHIVRPDGTHLDCLFTAALPGSLEGFKDILVTALDITDYKALQARLVTAQTEAARASRITTVGALTASIAHEVNTPVASILANVQAALRWLRRPEPNLMEAEQALDRAVVDASRTSQVIGRTRDFLSASPPQPRPVDLAETARIAAILVDRELRLHDTSIHLDASNDLPPVLADPIQMQQVLVNLMLNAVQAMRDQPAPRDVKVAVRGMDGSVRVSVTDGGPGIDAAVRPRLFEPFASSKADGMGIGLAICRTSVEAARGRIWLDDAVAPGATFHVSLPAATDQAISE